SGTDSCPHGYLFTLLHSVKESPGLVAWASASAEPLPFLAAVPVVYFLCSLVLDIAIALLQTAFELILLAVNDIEIVIRELAPLLLDLTLDLLPVTFDPIPVHGVLLG